MNQFKSILFVLTTCTTGCAGSTLSTTKVNDPRGDSIAIVETDAFGSTQYREFNGDTKFQQCMQNKEGAYWESRCRCETSLNGNGCLMDGFTTVGLYDRSPLDPTYIQYGVSQARSNQRVRVVQQPDLSPFTEKEKAALIQQMEIMRKELESIGKNLTDQNERLRKLEKAQESEGK